MTGLPITFTVGDFNRDGFADLIVMAASPAAVEVLLGRGDGTFVVSTLADIHAAPGHVGVGDFNEDGIPDLILGGEMLPTTIYLGRGDGGFVVGASYPSVTTAWSYFVGDLNHDGHQDVVGVNGTGVLDLFVLLGSGDGTFVVASSASLATAGLLLALGDFSDDGALDAVFDAVGTADGTSLDVLLGEEDAGFGAATTLAAPNQPFGAAVGDLNHDGCLDLALANLRNSTLGVLLGDCDGTFQPEADYPTAVFPPSFSLADAIALGDLNGDGFLDAAISTFASDEVNVFLGRGDGTFDAAMVYASQRGGDGGVWGSANQAIAVADFNGDGHLDLATANVPGGAVEVLLYTGCSE